MPRYLSVYRSPLAELGVPANGLDIEVAGIFDEMIGALIAALPGACGSSAWTSTR